MLVIACSWFGWDIESLDTPWEASRASIYEHIRSHIDPSKPGLTEGGETLPDAEIIAKGAKFGWVAGGLDGAFGHHGAGGPEADAAREAFQALRALLKKADSKRLGTLYTTLTDSSALDQVDPFLEMIANGNLDAERLHRLATWLATQAPDREPVKVALAILGLFRGDESLDLVLALGRHEEFTLYSAVALTNSLEEPEPSLWELGKHVDGWGRIQVVERLAETTDPQIKRWLLLEGYRNNIMYEYTATICARTGGLLEALQRPEPDGEVVRAAGDLLSTMIQGQGGPAEGIDDYADGAEATEIYVRHMVTRAQTLDDFLALHAIRRFISDREEDWTDRANRGWTEERRASVEELSGEILARDRWRESAIAGLTAEDSLVFSTAVQVATALGIDTWEHHFQRLERGDPNHWYHVMETDDPARVDRVLDLAAEQIPLEGIATGPADELGLGPQWSSHSALDFVLQGLRPFPGKGWVFLRAGIQSPVVRNRHMALRALSAWKRTEWPDDAEPVLRRALDLEPDDPVRERIEKVLAGEPLEDA